MHAFLYIRPDIKDIQKKAEELQAKLMEFPISKIGDVRELTNFTKLKLTEKTVILVKDFDKAGDEAQNAFLKALEEPQENLFYILTATNIENVLLTIQSRCEVVEVKSEKLKVTSDIEEKITNFINAKVGEKLLYISKINKREEALVFTNNLIILVHEIMIGDPDKSTLAEEALKLKRNLEANGNVQLQLTNFVVNIN